MPQYDDRDGCAWCSAQVGSHLQQGEFCLMKGVPLVVDVVKAKQNNDVLCQ